MTPSVCSQCGAPLAPGQTVCCMCKTPATGSDDSPSAPPVRFQFGLSSVLLIVTLVAIFCSIFAMSPGVGGVLLFFAIPAFLHTCVMALKRGAAGAPLPVGKKAAVFLLALVTVTLVIVAPIAVAVAAALATCAVAGEARSEADIGRVIFAGLAAGAIAGVVALVADFFVIRAILRHRRKQRETTESKE
jgi:hypothetical protein